jgi:hypothetical protein
MFFIFTLEVEIRKEIITMHASCHNKTSDTTVGSMSELYCFIQNAMYQVAILLATWVKG